MLVRRHSGMEKLKCFRAPLLHSPSFFCFPLQHHRPWLKLKHLPQTSEQKVFRKPPNSRGATKLAKGNLELEISCPDFLGWGQLTICLFLGKPWASCSDLSWKEASRFLEKVCQLLSSYKLRWSAWLARNHPVGFHA